MAELTTPFETTFDYPFQNVLPPTVSIAVDPCRMEGYLLHWLTLRGWCSFLFLGNADTDFNVESMGTYNVVNNKQDALRIGGDKVLVRAGSLTKAQTKVLKSIYLSPAVYALLPGSDSKIQVVQVYIEAGTFSIWRDSSSRMNIEVNLIFPTVKSQRT